MRKLAIAVAISLLPIFAVPAEAAVCTYKLRQVKDVVNQAYTKYRYVKYRSCR